MTEIKNPYSKSAQARKDQEDPWIMYLVVRESLEMSPGKIAAQVGHAVGMIYHHFEDTWGRMDCGVSELSHSEEARFNKCHDRFKEWNRDSFRKVVLTAKDKKWEKLKNKLTCFVVRDAGLTEIDPGSETVIGVLPMRRSERPNVLRKLQTL